MRPLLVWDWPLRLFHWGLVLLVCLSAITGNVGGNAMDWHGRIGVAIAGLLAFRLVWGFIGPTYARFANFVRGPRTIRAYLRGQWRGLGHNPIGALSVLGMLGVLGFQVVSGLVSNDDIAFNGPLYALVSKDLSDYIAGLHRLSVWVVALLVAAHLGAIVFYTRVKKESLIVPMITGIKKTEDADARPTRGGGAVALFIAVLFGCVTSWIAAGGLLAPPAALPAGSTPNW